LAARELKKSSAFFLKELTGLPAADVGLASTLMPQPPASSPRFSTLNPFVPVRETAIHNWSRLTSASGCKAFWKNDYNNFA
jgi:hypothetical protein